MHLNAPAAAFAGRATAQGRERLLTIPSIACSTGSWMLHVELTVFSSCWMTRRYTVEPVIWVQWKSKSFPSKRSQTPKRLD